MRVGGRGRLHVRSGRRSPWMPSRASDACHNKAARLPVPRMSGPILTPSMSAHIPVPVWRSATSSAGRLLTRLAASADMAVMRSRSRLLPPANRRSMWRWPAAPAANRPRQAATRAVPQGTSRNGTWRVTAIRARSAQAATAPFRDADSRADHEADQHGGNDRPAHDQGAPVRRSGLRCGRDARVKYGPVGEPTHDGGSQRRQAEVGQERSGGKVAGGGRDQIGQVRYRQGRRGQAGEQDGLEADCERVEAAAPSDPDIVGG